MTGVGWETTKLKYVADCNRHVLSETTSGDQSFKYVDIGAVGQGSIAMPVELTAFADAPSRARRLAEPGDTIISTVRTYLRAVATVPETDEDLVFSTGFAVLHPRPDVSRRFLAYVLQGDAFVDKVVANSVGVSYPAITASDLMTLDLLLPALDEQRAIADYLDQETAQIDALVAKQEELIGLLRERRRIVVPTILSEAKLTDHRPDKLHRRVRMGNGSTPRSGEDRYYVDGTVAWVNSSVVNQSEVWEPSKQVTQKAVDECHLPIVKPGSILVALTGQGKTRGAATILRITSTINQHLAFIEPDKRFWLPEYLLWVLKSNYDDLRRISSENGATKGGLTVGDLRELRVSMPDLDEQSRLVNKLEEASAQIDTLIAKAKEHIALAKERRSALITAAVTGQFDVRTARKAG